MKVTDNKTRDSQCKVEALGGNVKEVIADIGVDSHEIFRHLASMGIKPVIKVTKDAVITGSRAIDDVVREIGKVGSRGKRRMVMEGSGMWRVSLRRLSDGLVSM